VGTIASLLTNFAKRPAATKAAIEDCERALGTKLPEDYRDFLNFSNGGEGFIGSGSYCALYQVEDLPSRNEGYEVKTQAPGFLLIGSDGGGEAFGFDMRSERCVYVQMPFMPLEWEYARPLGSSFLEFLEHLADMQ